MCVEKLRIWVPFLLQMNEMNEKMSFKMGVKFAVPFFMCMIILDILYEIRGKVLRLNYKYWDDRPN